MNIIDILEQGGGLAQISRQFGLDEAQTRAAVEALGPVIGAGISRKAATGGGLADIIAGMVNSSQIDDPGLDGRTGVGNDILGQIFGSKDVSRGVAQQAAGLSGVGASLLKKMLPVITTMVMGYLAKRMLGGGGSAGRSGGGGLGDILGDILGGGGQSQAPQPRAQPGGGGLGDILKDILGGGGGGGRQMPEPQPGGGGLGDILKDILGGDGGMSPDQHQETVRRSRETIDDALGRRQSSTGNAADDLLNSVEQSIRRR